MAKMYFTATRTISLPSADAGVVSAIVRVHPSRIDVQRERSGKLARRQPVKLKNLRTGVSTIRFVIGAGGVSIQSPHALAVDYDTLDALGLNRKGHDPVEIGVLEASYLDILAYYLSHPDWGYRLATHMGFAGLVFGIFGATLGVYSLVI